MAFWVQKFGGSSLATMDLIFSVAKKIKRSVDQGHQLVIVVSAMQGDTDRLVSLTQAACSHSILMERERASLLATGEQQSSALLAMALIRLGVAAKSLNANQAGLHTQGDYASAHIHQVDAACLHRLCEENIVPIVTGFQGINDQGEYTTIGRGGSDLTAVVLAHWLEADECQIFTDVDGVYTIDPRVVADAMIVPQISYPEMLELSCHGAKVLQYRSVLYAAKFAVKVRVLHSAKDNVAGTLVSALSIPGIKPRITGIGLDRDQSKISLVAPRSELAFMQDFTDQIRSQYFDVDMFMFHEFDELIELKFTIHGDDFAHAEQFVRETVLVKSDRIQVSCKRNCAKISCIGVDMNRHAYFSSRLLAALNLSNITMDLLSSSHYRISLLVSVDTLERAAAILHREFIALSQSVAA
jgi:aspartate kinase